ncbi:PREDICTED: protein AMN1 homolog [Priapulus caudatus]|uniref:Protein AMN1 homolog n=1 Tax=Priapulus caudatus TaxID=37621 RepID=A0ABM1DW65_PRICU|nr:PREDICTED: protein AMN1 homolog [Priapulus caudatus]
MADATSMKPVRVATLFSQSIKCLVSCVDIYLDAVERLPANIKDRLLHLVCKRGRISDGNIGKLLHARVLSLDLSEGDVSDHGLKHVAKCTLLRKLDLNSLKRPRTTITTQGILQVVSACPHLHTICLRRCINITDAALVALSRHCRRLTALDVGGCAGVTDASLIALGQNCPLLRNINFSYSDVTDAGVLSLVSGTCAGSLNELHMSHCERLTDEAVEAVMSYCTNISIVVFDGCHRITQQSAEALDQLAAQHHRLTQLTWTVY